MLTCEGCLYPAYTDKTSVGLMPDDYQWFDCPPDTLCESGLTTTKYYDEYGEYTTTLHYDQYYSGTLDATGWPLFADGEWVARNQTCDPNICEIAIPGSPGSQPAFLQVQLFGRLGCFEWHDEERAMQQGSLFCLRSRTSRWENIYPSSKA